MQRARLGQHELGDRHFEAVAILGHAEVFAVHRALRRGALGAAGVFELLARLQQRLVADDAEAAHFLDLIVGVGDVVNRSTKIEDAIEPRKLMVDAIIQAAQDADLSNSDHILSSIDSLDVVASWTWPYEDLPALIAHDLNIQPRHEHIPDYHGGNQPAKLLDDAAKRVASGQCKVAVICGGEALASLAACAKAKKLPPPGWTIRVGTSAFVGLGFGSAGVGTSWQLKNASSTNDAGCVWSLVG